MEPTISIAPAINQATRENVKSDHERLGGMSFKFELWDIENGTVITRPIIVGKDDDNQPIFKNSSVFREDGIVAVKEIQVALDAVKAEYQKKVTVKH
jgi:hypothetical protein